MEQETKKLIDSLSPMWTNKQIWEFEQKNKGLTFDILCVEPKDYQAESSWNAKSVYRDSEIRDVIKKTFDHLTDGYELRITGRGQDGLEQRHVPYLMAVTADVMIEDETGLNFRMEDDCLVMSVDLRADVIDCKEFFEEFYHLATGFNYDADTGVPEDETEAEIYLTRLQEEFDQKMKLKLGDRYLPGNNDPDTLQAK